jgi:hypothetical protein
MQAEGAGTSPASSARKTLGNALGRACGCEPIVSLVACFFQ